MKKICLTITCLITLVLFGKLSNAQDIYTQDESSLGVCDGTAVFQSESPITQPVWLESDGTTIILQNSDSVSGLCAGDYFFAYVDSIANNDTLSFSIGTVDNSPCASYYVGANYLANYGGTDCSGWAYAVPYNGVAPYTFSWANGVNETTNNSSMELDTLCPGSQWVAVTDVNGCIDTFSFQIWDSLPCSNFNVEFNTYLASNDSTCDGSANIWASGGSENYTYTWSNGANTQYVNNLCPDSYEVIVSDGNLCADTISFTIEAYQPWIDTLWINMQIGDVSNNCDGFTYLQINGGVAPYDIEYSDGSTAQNATGLCEGFYTVTVTDANGLEATSGFIIGNLNTTIPPNNYIDSNIVDTFFTDVVFDCSFDINQVTNTTIDSYVLNGDSIQINWLIFFNNGDTVNLSTDLNFIENPQGVFSFVLSVFCPNKNNPSYLKAMENIYFGTASISNAEINAFNVYPNPTEGLVTISGTIANQQILVYDVRGKLILNTKANYGTHTLDLSSIEKGIYLISVEGTNTVQRVIKK